MNKMKKFHEKLKVFVIVGLLIITPLVSTSQYQRSSKYHLMIHFLLNILIIVVGADAGLLSFFLHSTPPAPSHTPTAIQKAPQHQKQDDSMEITKEDDGGDDDDDDDEEKEDDTDVLTPQSDNGASGDHHKSEDKSPPSDHRPTIFFIQEPADDVARHPQDINNNYGRDEEKEDEDNGDSISGQELYYKAETFIGNFYKQLKMQREHSRNKLHSHVTLSLS